MKICIFISSIDKSGGGPSRSVPILAKGLSLNEVDTTLFTFYSYKMNTHLLNGSSVDVKVLPQGINDFILEKELLEGHYDLIHAQNLWIPIYHKMAKIARKHSIPYIMTPRGCLEPWCIKQKRIKKFFAYHLYQKKDLEQAACILATSQMEADNIRALGITTPIAIIPNGIDIFEYKCRTSNDIKKIKNQILFLSRIHKKKGIEFLIRVWEQLNKQYPDWNVVIAGNGEESYLNHLRSMIKSKGLQNCVNIIPPVFGEEKHKLYCESSLFVLPTYSENFGMVISEAMSCGVPVITTTGTPWQELNEKRIGWCIELSKDNLAKTISAAIDMGQKKLFELGQQCSEHIRNNYNYIEVASKNKAVYEWIVLGEKRPDYII